jgi:hypothetical protein
VGGSFSVTATGIGGFTTGTNSFVYTGNNAETVGGITYNDLTFSHASATKTADGAITVNGAFATTSGGVLAMAGFQLSGAMTSVTHNGTITTSCNANPALPTGKDWSGTGGTSLVTFGNLTGGQFIPGGTYKTLTCTNTSGTNTVVGGDLTITGTFTTSGSGGSLDMGANSLSAGAVVNTGTLFTQNTSATPLPTGLTWAGTVNYNAATGGQTIAQGTYTSLVMGNTNGTNAAGGALTVNTLLSLPNAGATMSMSTHSMAGTLTTISNNGTITTENTSATPFTTGKTWGGSGTVVYSLLTGGQTVMAGTYNNNLTLSNTSGTNTASGVIVANAGLTTTAGGIFDFANVGHTLTGTFTATNNGTIQTICTVNPAIATGKTFGGTVIYARTTGGQNVSAGTYNNLTFLNSSGTNNVVGALTVNGALTTTNGGTIAMATNQLLGGISSLSHDGTLTTTCTLNPAIPSGKDWSGTGGTSQVTFALSTGNQQVPAGTFKTLVFSNTSNTNTVNGDIAVTTGLTTTSGGTVNMGTNLLSGAFTPTNGGTLRTQNTSGNPISSSKTWAGIVNYDATTGGQTVSEGTYNILTMGNTSGTNTAGGSLAVNTTLNISNAASTLDMSTFALSGAFAVPTLGTIKTANLSATPVPAGKTWNAATTINYNAATGAQTIVQGTYGTLRLDNTSGTSTAAAALTVNTALNIANAGATMDMSTFALAGTLTTISNNGTISTNNTSATPFTTGRTWGGSGTVRYNVAGGGQTVMAGTYNNNLTVMNTSGVNTVSGTVTANATLTTTAGGTLNFGTASHQLLGATITPVNNGTILTVCSVAPAIPAGETWAGTVIFNSLTGSQTIPSGTYNNVTLNNTSGTVTASGDLTVNGALVTTNGGTVAMGTNQLLGSLSSLTHNGTITTTCTVNPAVPSGKTWTGSGGTSLLSFGATSGAQFIPAGTYKSIACANTTGTNTVTGSIAVSTTFTVTGTGANGTLDMGANVLSGAFTPTLTGSLKTQNTSATPIPTGKTWGGTVNYNATTGSQTIVQGTYATLRNDNTSGTNIAGGALVVNTGLTVANASATLNMATFAMSGTMTTISNSGTIQTSNTSATPFTTGKTWGGTGTVVYAVTTGGQTVMAGTYTNNLTVLNTSGTNTVSGTITANGTLTTTAGGILRFGNAAHQLLGATLVPANSGTILTVCSVNPAIPSGKTWGGLVSYSSTTGAQTLPAGTYNNLSFLNTSGTNTVSGTATVNGALITTNGGTIDFGANQLLGSLSTLTHNGTISTSCTVNPAIPSGKTWTGSGGTSLVSLTRTAGAQFLPAGTYKSIACANTSGTNTVTGSISVSTTFTVTGTGANGTLDMGANVLSGAFTPTLTGVLKTQNTSATPIPTGKTWGGTVNYNAGTGGQTVVQGTYATLRNDNTSGTNTAGGALVVNTGLNVANASATLDMSTFAMSGTMTTISNNGTIQTSNTSATPFTTGKTWGGTGTVIYAVTTGGQTVMAGTYTNNLTVLNTSGTNTVSGSITANATLTTTAGGILRFGNAAHQLLGATLVPANSGTILTICTVNPAIPASKTWGGLVSYSATAGAQTLPAGTFNNLSILNTSGTNTVSGTATVNGALITTNGGTTDFGANQLLGSLSTLTHNGTISTSCTVNPAIPASKDWSGSGGTSRISLARTAGAQFLPAGTYKSIACANTSGTNTVTGSISVSTTFTVTGTGANGTLDMGANVLSGAFTPTLTGVLKTQNTSATPIPTGKTWGGTVNYNAGTGGQTVVQGTYATLRNDNTSGTNTAGGALVVNTGLTVANASATMDMSTFAMSGTMTTISNNGTIQTSNTSATPFTTGKTWGGTGTVIYAVTTGGQTVMAGTYTNNLTVLNTSGTNTVSGTITANATLTTTAGGTLRFGNAAHQLLGATLVPANSGTIHTICSVNPAIPASKTWGGALVFIRTNGAQTLPAGTYNDLSFLNTSGTNTVSGTATVNGALTTTSGGTIDFGVNQLLGSLSSLTHNGTISTSCTVNPAIPASKDWSGSGGTSRISFARTAGAQFIPAGTYKSIACANTSGTNTVTGNIAVSTTFTVTGTGTNGNLDMGINVLSGSFTPTLTGTLRTQNSSSNPLPSGLTWGGTVNYDGTGAQTLVTGSFARLGLSVIRTGSPTITLQNGAINLSSDFIVTATGIGAFATGTNTFTYTNNSDNLVGGITYNNLAFTNTANTKTAGGDVTVNGTLSIASGGTFALSTFALGGSPVSVTNNGSVSTSCTVNPAIPSGYNWSGTTGLVTFGRTTGGQFIPAGTYKTLTCGNTSGTNTAVGSLTVTGTFTTNGTNGILNMGTNNFSALTVTNTAGGTIRTQSTSATPIPSGKSIAGTVTYDKSDGGQTIVQGTFNALTISNSSGTNNAGGNLVVNAGLTTGSGTAILDMGTNTLTGTLSSISGGGTIKTASSAATPITTAKTWTQAVEYNRAAGGQTIISGIYNGGLANSNTSGSNTVAAAATITVTGTLTLSPSSLLADNNRTITVNGNIAGTGTHSVTASGRITMVGSGGTISGATLGNLQLNNAGGFSLTGDPIVNGTLTLTAGRLTLGSNNLTLGTTAAAVAGSPASGNMIVTNGAGELRKRFTATGSYVFPVGDNTPIFSPITVNVTSGTPGGSAYVGASVKNVIHPENTNTTDYLARYWSVNVSDITTPVYSLTATYNSADIVGTESSISAGQYDGSLPWVRFGAANTVSDFITAGGLTDATSDFTGLSSSAPSVNVLPLTSTVCSGEPTGLTASGSGDAPLTYTWAPSTGLSATTGASVVASPTTGTVAATVVYTVTITDGNGFTSTATSAVSVNPSPIATATVVPSAVCEGGTIVLNSGVVGGSGVYTDFEWTGPSGFTASTQNTSRTNVTGAHAGVYSFTATDASGCVSAPGTTAIVTVNTNPAITATVSPTTVCGEGGTLTLTSTPTGGSGVYSAFAWTGPSSFTATTQNPSRTSITTAHSGVYSVVVTDDNGCSSAVGVTTTTNIYVAPVITIPNPICAGSLFTFSATPSGGTWTSNNNAAVTITMGTGAVTSSGVGNATIEYTDLNGCITSSVVTVTPTMTANTGETYMCLGQPQSALLLSNATPGGTWTSSDQAKVLVNVTSGFMRGLVAGTVHVTYALSAGCFTTTVETVVAAVATITGTANICPGTTASLVNSTPAGTWSSSIPANATIDVNTGVVTGIVAGTSSITYQVNPGCYKVMTQIINPLPGNISGTAAICEGSSATLACSPSGGTWVSGTPAVATINSSSGLVTPITAGTTPITYTATTGCQRAKEITINPLPTAITGTASVCIGLTTTLNTTPGGGAWTSSNAGRASVDAGTGVVTGITAGTCNITYTLNGCIATRQVTVNSLPTAIGGVAAICVNGTSTLSSTPSGGTWTSSNTSVATINVTTGFVNGGASPGTSTITYQAATGCIRTRDVTVNTSPGAVTGTLSTCIGSTTTLSSSGGGTWSSSNMVKATVHVGTGVVAGLTEGTSTISYIVSAGCFSTAVVTVNPLPAAITGTNSFCAGNTSAFSTLTVGGVWSSSNTGVATINSSTGLVYGVASGNATISYVLSTGCLATRPVTVNPLPTAIGGANSVCHNSTTTLTSTPGGGVWSSNNLSVATVDAFTGEVTGTGEGTATITYTLATGCIATKLFTVDLEPTPITGTDEVCEGSTTALSSTPGDGTWTSSDPDVATVNASTGVVTGLDANAGTGVTTITYELGDGCTVHMDVTVNPLPSGITGTASVCVGSVTTLNALPGGGAWSSSNTGVATVDASTGVVTGLVGGTTMITYLSAAACYVTREVTVNVLPDAISGSLSMCINDNTTLSSLPGGGVWTSSNPGIASVNASTGVVSSAGSAGNTTITYTTTDGCQTASEVTVNLLPPAITGTLDVCVGATTTLSSSGGGTWSSSNLVKATVNSATGVVAGLSNGTATISYVINTGCYRTVLVTVNALPAAITGVASVCEGAATPLASLTPGGTWSSSQTDVATIGSSSGVVRGIDADVFSGNTTISYTLSTGCRVTTIVTVNGTPDAIGGTASVCINDATTLSSLPGGGAWSSSNALRATVNSGSGVVAGITSGTAVLSYVLGNGCYAVKTVTVNALPTTPTGTAVVCEGLTTTLASTPGGGTWTTSNVSIATVNATLGIVRGIDDGNATISYQASNGCFSTREVTVNVSPVAISGTTAVCIGSTTSLNSTPGGGVWTSSLPAKGSIDASTGVVTGISGGTTSVTYTLSGCLTSAIVTVNTLPAVISGVSLICAGSAGTLASSPAGGVWSSSAPAIATVNSGTGVVAGIGVGNATISYTNANNCSRTQEVTVNAAVTANSGTALLCTGQPVSVVLLTNATPGGVWSSSNVARIPVNSVSGLMKGLSTGTANITYAISSGCYTVTEVTVNGAVATITGTANVCSGATVTLANATADGTWSSSNLAKATIDENTGDITGISAGTTTVTYLVSAGCYKTQTQTVLSAPGAISGAATVLEAANTTLTCSPGGGTWSSSNLPVATINASTGSARGISAGATLISYTLSTGCRSTHSLTVIALKPGNPASSGPQTPSEASIVVFPNPTSGILTVETSVTGTFTLYTLDGKEVNRYPITRTSMAISLPHDLAAGVYMGTFEGSNGSKAMIRLVYNP